MRVSHGREVGAGSSRRRAPAPRVEPRHVPVGGPEQRLLALQRLAGNAAVTGLLVGAAPPVVQRALVGEFLDPTPPEDTRLDATESNGKLVSEPFIVRARIAPTADETEGCTPGQYRQAVKGEFRQDGVPQEHLLDDGPLSRDAYLEDRIGGQRYGYRATSGGATSSWFSDEGCTATDLKNGCHFQSWDQPTAYKDDDEMDLHFRGRLFDTRVPKVLKEREWSVYGKKQTSTT